MQTQILNFEDYNGALEEQFMTCEAHYNASFRLPYSHAYRHFERLNQWLARSERNFPQPLNPARLSSARKVPMSRRRHAGSSPLAQRKDPR